MRRAVDRLDPADLRRRLGQRSVRRREPAVLETLRPKRIALIAAGVSLFLAISIELARFFSVENAERAAAVTLIEAEARGDASAMLAHLSGCGEQPSCVATVRENATTLERSGAPKILSLKSETAYALGGKTGKTRLAWAILGGTPVVQCIDVRRTGNVLSGIDVHLLSISAPIAGDADC